MDRNRHLVEVALKLKSGCLDELFVLGIVWNRRQVLGDVDVAHPAQIRVNVAVRAGKKAGRLGRCVLTQLDYYRKCGEENEQTEQNWEPSPKAHVGMGKNDSIRRGSAQDMWGRAPSQACPEQSRRVRSSEARRIPEAAERGRYCGLHPCTPNPAMITSIIVPLKKKGLV